MVTHLNQPTTCLSNNIYKTTMIPIKLRILPMPNRDSFVGWRMMQPTQLTKPVITTIIVSREMTDPHSYDKNKKTHHRKPTKAGILPIQFDKQNNRVTSKPIRKVRPTNGNYNLSQLYSA